MNKEEILNKYCELINEGYCEDCNELNCLDNFPHRTIANAIIELRGEKKQLQARIDKAIEYIKPKFVAQGGFTSYEWNDLLNELLDILEGNNEKEN